MITSKLEEQSERLQEVKGAFQFFEEKIQKEEVECLKEIRFLADRYERLVKSTGIKPSAEQVQEVKPNVLEIELEYLANANWDCYRKTVDLTGIKPTKKQILELQLATLFGEENSPNWCGEGYDDRAETFYTWNYYPNSVKATCIKPSDEQIRIRQLKCLTEGKWGSYARSMKFSGVELTEKQKEGVKEQVKEMLLDELSEGRWNSYMHGIHDSGIEPTEGQVEEVREAIQTRQLEEIANGKWILYQRSVDLTKVKPTKKQIEGIKETIINNQLKDLRRGEELDYHQSTKLTGIEPSPEQIQEAQLELVKEGKWSAYVSSIVVTGVKLNSKQFKDIEETIQTYLLAAIPERYCISSCSITKDGGWEPKTYWSSGYQTISELTGVKLPDEQIQAEQVKYLAEANWSAFNKSVEVTNVRPTAEQIGEKKTEIQVKQLEYLAIGWSKDYQTSAELTGIKLSDEQIGMLSKVTGREIKSEIPAIKAA